MKDFLSGEQQAVLDLGAQMRRERALRIQQHLSAYLEVPHRVNRSVASIIELGFVDGRDLNRLERYLGQQLRLYKGLSCLRFANEAGEYLGVSRLPDGSACLAIKTLHCQDQLVYHLNSQGDRGELIGLSQGYDPRTHPWYQKAKRTRKATWSPIDPDSANASVELAIAAVLPVYYLGHFLGVVACDLPFEQIGEFLQSLDLDSGIAFILDREGELVASSTRAKGGIRQRATQCQDARIQATAQALLSSPEEWLAEESHFSLECEGQTYLAEVFGFQEPLGDLHWSIALVSPERELEARVSPGAWSALQAAYASLKRQNRQLSLQVAEKDLALARSLMGLQEREAPQQLDLEGSHDGVWEWDIQSDRITFSASWPNPWDEDRRDISLPAPEWIARIHPEDRFRVERALADHWQQRSPIYTVEYRIRCYDGSYQWILDRGRAYWDGNGQPQRMAGLQIDISDRKATEAELHRSAYYDPLTGLPNRKSFFEQLDRCLDSCRCLGGVAVAFIDLDGFKQINDTLGHPMGDLLLVQVGKLLRQGLRSTDFLARLGGDEFGLLLAPPGDRVQCSDIARRILFLLEQPIATGEHTFRIGASIGIAFSHNENREMTYTCGTDLLRDADLAMYCAKRQGKGCIVHFEPRMREEALLRASLEGELRRAIDYSQLHLLYQPIVALASGKTISFEALIRWQHPQRGLLQPHDFLTIAEESGAILPLGNWVMLSACWQMQRWLASGIVDPRTTVSVNVAGQQLIHGMFIDEVKQILQVTGLSPANLCLEITEGAIARGEQAISQLRELRQLGTSISIDDFGTGYSSLTRLQTLPADTLKIDRSFVEGLGQQQSEAIVSAIVHLASSSHLRVVAEGIETPQQRRFLQQLDCDYGQGYLFSPPLEATSIESCYSAVRSSPELTPGRSLANLPNQSGARTILKKGLER